MRITGFIALLIVAVTAISSIVVTNLRNTIPEPHASCIEAWRSIPDNPLMAFGSVDLKLTDRSRMEPAPGGLEHIVTAVGPAARASGQPVTLRCTRKGADQVRAIEGN